MTAREGRLTFTISEYHVVMVLLYARETRNNTGNLIESSLYQSQNTRHRSSVG
ncbi:MAG: hypothetical protein JWN12_331 [Candidatus Saccharibacteria bacterium]|nr:hypothetical protein [Candidatus Saccharibacteria bacterium]